jgi:hypothetical protein
MTNKRRYLYLHKGDNEWLACDPPTDDSLEEWNNAWEELKAKCPHEIEITEDMYANDEYGDLPEWVDVTIDDEGVLAFKMARGVIGGLKGARSVVFDRHYDLDVSEEWGGWDYTRLEVFEGGAFLTFRGKHSSAEVEVNITEQFNQAIGE